ECRGAEFARDRLPGMLRPDAVRKLAWHKERRHHCVLASASLDLYVQPWAAAAGFDDVLCTSLEYAGEAATGAIDGCNCRGEEKVRRLRERFGDLARLTLHGYGDSADDRPFLALCGNASYRPFRDRPEPVGETKAHDRPLDFLRLMRPHQWVKNAFVFL